MLLLNINGEGDGGGGDGIQANSESECTNGRNGSWYGGELLLSGGDSEDCN